MAGITVYSTVGPARDDEGRGAFSLSGQAVEAGLATEILWLLPG